MTNKTDLFVAKEAFTTTLDGVEVTVKQGVTRVRAGHPLLKGREMYFEPLTVHYDIEDATARPGEARGSTTAKPVDLDDDDDEDDVDVIAKPVAKPVVKPAVPVVSTVKTVSK